MEVLPINSNYNNSSSKQDWDYESYCLEDETSSALAALTHRLEVELRAARSTHFTCGEVLLPCNLLPSLARNIIRIARSELCGLRGCTLYLNFESEEECRKLSTIKFDPTTTSTFELYVTLKQTHAGWNSFLPQFLKKITRGSTVVISSEYDLNKKQLYRSYSD